MKQTDNKQTVGINLRAYRTGYAAWASRFINALDEGVSRYPIYRELRFAARIELEVLLDAIEGSGEDPLGGRLETSSRPIFFAGDLATAHRIALRPHSAP